MGEEGMKVRVNQRFSLCYLRSKSLILIADGDRINTSRVSFQELN